MSEFLTGHEHSRQFDLQALYETTMTTIKSVGTYVTEPDEVIRGLLYGMPIVETTNPRYTVELSGNRIHQILPWAAEELKIGDKLNINYAIPSLVLDVESDNYEYLPPHCTFVVEKGREAEGILERESISLILLPSFQSAISVRRNPTYKEEYRIPEALDAEETMIRIIKNRADEEEFGLNRHITINECQALQQVVENVRLIIEWT